MAIKKTALVGYTVNAETPASLLLHFEGVNGSSAFVDSSAYLRTVSAAGNAQISAATSKWTDVSGQFAGDGSYLTLAADESNNLGAEDFTVEFWANLQFSQYSAVLSNSTTAQDTGSYIIGFDNADLFGMFYDVPQFNSLSVDISSYYGAWAHYAFVRSNGVLTFYINGIKQTSVVTNSNFTTALPSTLRIGSRWTNQNNYWLNSYLDDLRITKGLAVYTGNFIPPRGPLTPYVKPEPVAAQASLLLHFDGNFNDSSGNNKYVTLGGNAALSAAQSKFGGYSAYFDGNSNYLLIDTTSSENFESQNWTTELWFYPNSTAGDPRLLSRQDINTGFVYQLRIYNSAPQVLLRKGDGSDYLEVGGGIVVEENKWHHVAVVRNGNNVSLYVDGILDQTIAISGAYSSPLNAPWIIGAFADTSLNVQLYFSGYIDDLRITKGVAVYTKNFNPPIAPLTPIAEQDVLPSIPASLLLRFDGADNSTNFKDSSVNALTVTVNGSAKISTAQSKWGGSSLFVQRTGARVDYISVSGTENFNLAKLDWTIEAWVYPLTTNDANGIVAIRSASENELALVLYVFNGSTHLVASTQGTQWAINGSGALTVNANEWSHIAAVRYGDKLTVYVNGSVSQTFTFSGSIYNSSEPVRIGTGGYTGGNQDFNGYIDDFRIVKGHAVYTENFTPPTAPVDSVVRPPEGTAASLLLHFNGDFNDSSPNALTVTANGNATISTAQSKFGGSSGYLGAPGDSLSLSAASLPIAVDEDFTIEAWIYLPTGVNFVELFGMNSKNYFIVAPTVIYFNGDYDPQIVANYTFPTDVWQHVAVTRANNTLRVFVAGQIVHTVSESKTYFTQSPTLTIGRQNDGGPSASSYIDDLRITKGLAVYTDTFVPPTAPLSPYAKPVEPAAQASLLLHFDGNFNDSSGNGLTVTASGNATTSTTQSKFGGSSSYFDGSSYIQTSSYSWRGPVTVEFWMYATSANNNGQNHHIVTTSTSNSDGNFSLMIQAGRRFAASRLGWSQILSTPDAFAVDNWTHVAFVVDQAGNASIFADGKRVASGAANLAWNDVVSPLTIGSSFQSSDQLFAGYIDDFRVTKGLAVYTDNFIPPEAPLSPIAKPKPVEAQSSLLLHFNGANGSTTIKDSSVNALTVTPSGNAVISTAQSKWGGSSLALNNYGDHASVPYSPYFDFAAGEDFTVEVWIYPTALNGYQVIVGRYTSSAPIGWLVQLYNADIRFYADEGTSLGWSNNFGVTLSENKWQHIAVCRQNGVIRHFVDGTLYYTVENNAALGSNNGQNLAIGAATFSGGDHFYGYIDDLRIVKGLAVYTGNFTPPTKPLTGIASPAPALPAPTVPVDYLVVAGGGSGGVRGGGGGAGGYLESTALALTANTPVTVTVGAGGAGVGPYYYDRGNNGSDSVLGDITAIGGGGGGGLDGTGQLYYGGPQNDGASGGSGGGGGVGWYHGGYGGSGTSGQGYNGGNGTDTNNAQYESCGGGGGASAPGGNGAYGDFQAGDGGAGLYSGLAHGWFCGGGGGGANPDTYAWGAGGVGGGGGGAMAGYAESGYSNSGGGGGGCSYQFGDFSGDGGSGYVCIRFPNTHTLTVGPGLTYTTYDDGTNIAYYFTAGTDTITFTN